MKTEVEISKKAYKQLSKVPRNIRLKFYVWVNFLEDLGLLKVRETPGFHDEPLKGKRAGQRSIRLNKAYRAIYIEKDGELEVIEVLEVNKHEY